MKAPLFEQFCHCAGHGCETRCFSIKIRDACVFSLGRNHGFKELPFPYHPCMVHVGNYAIHGWYGIFVPILVMLKNGSIFSHEPDSLKQKLFHHSRSKTGVFLQVFHTGISRPGRSQPIPKPPATFQEQKRS